MWQTNYSVHHLDQIRKKMFTKWSVLYQSILIFFCPVISGGDPFSDDPFFGARRQHQSRLNCSRTGSSFFGGFVGFPPYGAGFSPFDSGKNSSAE